MPASPFVHIVPTVPPAINGLADYCFKLWEHWPQPRPQWHCLAARVPAGAQQAWPQAHIEAFSLDKKGLLGALNQTKARCVVLHYVGYSYHSRGVPLWLPRALRAWKNGAPGGEKRRVCVMFHEVWASGSPRSSAFWLAPLAKNIVGQLLQVADHWVTSNEAAAADLVHLAGADVRRGRLVPVGANIEPQTPIDWARPVARARGLRVAVFGLPHSRIAALSAHLELMKLACQSSLVSQISLIGKAGDAAHHAHMETLQTQIAPLHGAPPHGATEQPVVWQTHFDLAPAAISQLLREDDLMLSRNHPRLLTKSGVYAAACVHGLITVCAPVAPSALGDSGLPGAPTPHLANDDHNASATARFLADESQMHQLRARVGEAAQGSLSWQGIVRAWSEIAALPD